MNYTGEGSNDLGNEYWPRLEMNPFEEVMEANVLCGRICPTTSGLLSVSGHNYGSPVVGVKIGEEEDGREIQSSTS